MDFERTLMLLIGSAVCFAVSLFLGKKAEPMTRLSYVPWTGIQFLCLLMIFVLGAHLFSEWRGTPLVGTRNPLRGL